MKKNITSVICVALFVMVILARTAVAAEPIKVWSLSISTVALGNTPETTIVRKSGSMSMPFGSGKGAVVGGGYSEANSVSFQWTVSGIARKEGFFVTVKANSKSGAVQPIDKEYDLTSMKPLTIEVVKDDGAGHAVSLNLIPSIEEHSTEPQQFRPADLHPEQFAFQGSVIILNDEKFLGRMDAAGGRLAWFEVPGLGKVEFSLLQFRDAKPIGTLSNGNIRIELDPKQIIEISSVRNGLKANVLEGGPYRIWVRWTPSTKSIQEWSDQFEAIVKSNKDIPQELLEIQRKRIRAGQVMSSGVGGIDRRDQIKQP